jgi:N-acetylmuramoyl-L-alanine amidase
MRNYIAVLFAVTIFAVPWAWFTDRDGVENIVMSIYNAGSQLAAVVMHKPKTVEDLKSKYDKADKKKSPSVKILLMPGHEPDFGGAEFRNLKEREMNVELANSLASLLKNNPRYEVVVARDNNSWHPVLSDYFKNSWNEIIEWNNAYKQERENLISVGKMQDILPSVIHNKTPQGPATRLLGINKWGNENDVDVAIHIHFNDDNAHPRNTPGKYSGFAVYIPESQYYNSVTSKALAEKVFTRLAKYNAISDFHGEATGLVESPDLIAIGSNNSVDYPSMLIEYGYMYEKQFLDDSTRGIAIKDLAYQTYLGLQDFFDPNNSEKLSISYDTLLLPYRWNNDLTEKASSELKRDIFALQSALIYEGLYPPTGKDKNDCPRTGTIGPCTKQAISVFKDKYGISDDVGIVGQKTRDALNSKFSQ